MSITLVLCPRNGIVERMEPQTSKPLPEAQPAPQGPAPVSPQLPPDKTAKAIKNARTTARLLGIFLLVIDLITLIPSFSGHYVPGFGYVDLFVILAGAIGYIVFSGRLQPQTDPQKARRYLKMIALISAVILVVDAINAFTEHKGYVGLPGSFGFLALIYFGAVLPSRIKQ